VLLTTIVAIKNEPGGARAVEIAEPRRFAVKLEPDAVLEPDAELAAASQPNPPPGLDA